MTVLQRAWDDAERHHESIMRRLAGAEFAWDYRRSLVDVPLVKALAAPRISAWVLADGSFEAGPEPRYEEISSLLLALVEHGYSSARGAQMIARLHEGGARLAMLAEDQAYLVTALMFEPIRWNARFGGRRFSEAEKYANYCFWREIGKRLQLTKLPESYEACELFNEDYEDTMRRRTHTSVVLAEVLFGVLERSAPAATRSLVRSGLTALVDDAVLACFDLPPASRWSRWLASAVLRLGASARRAWPRRPAGALEERRRSYRLVRQALAISPSDSRR